MREGENGVRGHHHHLPHSENTEEENEYIRHYMSFSVESPGHRGAHLKGEVPVGESMPALL